MPLNINIAQTRNVYRTPKHYERTSTDLYTNTDGLITIGNNRYQAQTGDTCTFLNTEAGFEDLFIYNASAHKWTLLA